MANPGTISMTEIFLRRGFLEVSAPRRAWRGWFNSPRHLPCVPEYSKRRDTHGNALVGRQQEIRYYHHQGFLRVPFWLFC
jgi:hypothetical protein